MYGLQRGGVITGHVADEDGQPLAQAVVTVHRQVYVQGERQLVPAGIDQSDDRGQYRVFGLAPGDYFVSATAGGVERLAQQLLPMLGGAAAPETTGYAPTYYPGAIAPAEAARVRLGPGQELSGIDFPLQLVALATVRGVVSGGPATVMLLPEGGLGSGGGRGGGRGGMAGLGGGRGGDLGAMIGAAIGGALRGAGLRATTQADGTFAIPGVTPGNYTIVARSGEGGRGGEVATAIQPITVSGSEISVALSPAPGVTASGTVTLEASGGAPGALSGFRVSLTALGAAAAVPRQNRPAEANERGEFTVADLIPGHYIVSGQAPQGWTMKAVYVNGADATDRSIEIASSGASGINLIFTDRLASLSGSVRNGSSEPAAGIPSSRSHPTRRSGTRTRATSARRAPTRPAPTGSRCCRRGTTCSSPWTTSSRGSGSTRRSSSG
jgi:hypothetical protein